MYKTILLPIDLEQESSWQKAVSVAVKLAKQNGANIHVLTVIPDYGMPVVSSFFPGNYARDIKESTTTELKVFVEKYIPAELLADYHVVMYGSIYKEILNFADEKGCDLIVISSQRPEMSDYLLGTNAARVVRHSSQSVFVIR